MPCIFHANLFALDVARCPLSTCGVLLGSHWGDVLKWLVKRDILATLGTWVVIGDVLK